MGKVGRTRFLARKMRHEGPLGGSITELAQDRACRVLLLIEKVSKNRTHCLVAVWVMKTDRGGGRLLHCTDKRQVKGCLSIVCKQSTAASGCGWCPCCDTLHLSPQPCGMPHPPLLTNPPRAASASLAGTTWGRN